MARAIARILVSQENESKFAALQVLQARDSVDQIVFVEHNFTHTGVKKDYTFKNYEKEISKYSNKGNVSYLYVDLADKIIQNTKNADEMHFNETLMRKSFLEELKLKDSDYVYLLDADEIIFRRYYRIINILMHLLGRFNFGFRLPMNQFFYRMNYLWTELVITNTTVVSVSNLRRSDRYLRDYGIKFPMRVGSHYSWQLTVSEMLLKLKSYAHSADYAHLANAALLSAAISEKKYPFEPDRPFTIKELSKKESRKYFPSDFELVENQFEYLFTLRWSQS
jgi:hypothetical protein